MHGVFAGEASAGEKRRRVLVVDDEVLVARAHARILRRVCEVTWCTSFDEAVALLEQERFDLLLSDLELGGKSGLDLLAIAAGRWPRMRRLLCTGIPAGAVPRERAARLASRVLEKPVAVEILRAAVLELAG